MKRITLNNKTFDYLENLTMYEGQLHDDCRASLSQETLEIYSISQLDTFFQNFINCENQILSKCVDDNANYLSTENGLIQVFDIDQEKEVLLSKQEVLKRCSFQEMLLDEHIVTVFMDTEDMIGDGVTEHIFEIKKIIENEI